MNIFKSDLLLAVIGIVLFAIVFAFSTGFFEKNTAKIDEGVTSKVEEAFSAINE